MTEPGSIVTARDFSERSDAYHREHFPESDQVSAAANLLMLRAANLLRSDAEREVLRPLGLRWTGFSVVFALTLYGTLEAYVLARVAGVTRQAISLVLATLERDGFIERSPGADRRKYSVTLTARGEEVATAAISGQVRVAGDWFGGLDPQEREQLAALLRKALQNRPRRG